MSEFGDDMREHRQYVQRMRATWQECPDCAVRFGTGTKNPPGTPCRNCGWVDPKFACECVECGRRFKSAQGLADHARDKHAHPPGAVL